MKINVRPGRVVLAEVLAFAGTTVAIGAAL
jgi:hypothetical protein